MQARKPVRNMIEILEITSLLDHDIRAKILKIFACGEQIQLLSMYCIISYSILPRKINFSNKFKNFWHLP